MRRAVSPRRRVPNSRGGVVGVTHVIAYGWPFRYNRVAGGFRGAISQQGEDVTSGAVVRVRYA